MGKTLRCVLSRMNCHKALNMKTVVKTQWSHRFSHDHIYIATNKIDVRWKWLQVKWKNQQWNSNKVLTFVVLKNKVETSDTIQYSKWYNANLKVIWTDETKHRQNEHDLFYFLNDAMFVQNNPNLDDKFLPLYPSVLCPVLKDIRHHQSSKFKLRTVLPHFWKPL
jgi:hypothetical protein